MTELTEALDPTVTRLRAEYVPTARNGLVADLLPRLGFAAGTFDLTADAAGPRFVTIKETA